MAKNFKLSGEYFCGNKISNYGIDSGYLDYQTLAKAFDCVLANGLLENTANVGYWELVNGFDFDNETEEPCEIYQYYIISSGGASILQDYTDEIVYYNDVLDLYLWGVTHFGTSWDYVLTDIPCNCG